MRETLTSKQKPKIRIARQQHGRIFQ